MDIKLSPQAQASLHASIQRFVAEEYGASLGLLGAETFLRFCLTEIGPAIYNKAVADAQACMQERVTELEHICFAEETGYWDRAAKRPAARKPGPR
jgi:uncharacterized protein (DUF2164 family)